MTLDTYRPIDPRLTDRVALTRILQSSIDVTTHVFRSLEPKITLVDHPCGFGKTSCLLSVINERPDLKFLVVVNTLLEVDRILSGVSKGHMFAPKDALEAGTNKSEQLEEMLLAKKSVVITHKLYERAGWLADYGLLQDYSVIIDEVPNAVSVKETVKLGSMEEIYLKQGFLDMSPNGELTVTQKWVDMVE